MEKTVLQVQNLKVSFDTKKGLVTAVNGVDFVLKEKKTLGIVGESGCGKSVTSLSIMGLLSAQNAHIDSESRIMFKGKDLTKMSNRQMCKVRGKEISMIFQDPMTSLNPVFTIGKQISETIRVHQKVSRSEAWNMACEMLINVGIPEPQKRMKAFPHQLSGGMRQRVMIAMALACQPEILIADEPTTALDVTIQAQILELMRELKKSINTSIIMITHDMGIVAEMADEIMVMYAGEVVEHASAEEIFSDPKHPYTRGLLASIPRLDMDTEKLYSIQGAVPSLWDMPTGCRFCERCPEATGKCKNQKPDLYQANGHSVRCFCYDKGSEVKQ
ncbi:ABC transporter ATP-binding protein [Roseburia hominis]